MENATFMETVVSDGPFSGMHRFLITLGAFRLTERFVEEFMESGAELMNLKSGVVCMSVCIAKVVRAKSRLYRRRFS